MEPAIVKQAEEVPEPEVVVLSPATSYDVFDGVSAPAETEAARTEPPRTEPPRVVVAEKGKRRLQTEAPYIPPVVTEPPRAEPKADATPYIPPAQPREQSGAGPIIAMEGHWMGYATCEMGGCIADTDSQIGIDFRLVHCGQGYFYTLRTKMTTIRPYHCDKDRILASLHNTKGDTVGYIFFVFSDERSLTASINWTDGNQLWQLNADRMDYR